MRHTVPTMNPTLQWAVLHWAALHGGNPTHSRLLMELCCGHTHLSGAWWGWLKDACLHLGRESGIHRQDDEVWHLWTQCLHPLIQNLTGCVDLFLTRQKQQHIPWNSQVALSLFIHAGLTHYPSLPDPSKTARHTSPKTASHCLYSLIQVSHTIPLFLIHQKQ